MVYYSTSENFLPSLFNGSESTNPEKYSRDNPAAAARVMQNVCRGVSMLRRVGGRAIPERIGDTMERVNSGSYFLEVVPVHITNARRGQPR